MHKKSNSPQSNARAVSAPSLGVECFRRPVYECRTQAGAMELTVYLPGIAANSVDIEGSGTDLTVTARKPHFVRENFAALHLERAQRDYRLRLRVGTCFEYAAMQAEISQGVLKVTLPRRRRRTGLIRPQRELVAA
jgi:HSP20 family molecular chaperone IbpA